MQPWEDPTIEQTRKKYLQFAEAHLEGEAPVRDLCGEFSLERWHQCAAFGALGICLKKVYGGQELPLTHAVAAFDGLGYGCRDGGFIYAMCSQLFGIQMVLQTMASEEIKRHYLPQLISGEFVAAHGFTEVDAGSDAFSMAATATEEGDGFRLNGRKSFITNAPQANVALVFAKTAAERSPFGLTGFWVDLRWQGASHGREFEKVGLRTVHMGELIFDNVFVPKDHVVGGKGGGLRVLAASTGWERALLLSVALGPMARAVNECIARAKARRQFDRPIGSYQQISSKIADMIMRHRICRQVIYDIASRLDKGVSIQNVLQDAAITKLFVSENYIQIELHALQIFGVRGYLMDSFVQQDLRDSLSSTIYAGTSETLRNTIAKFAGLPVN